MNNVVQFYEDVITLIEYNTRSNNQQGEDFNLVSLLGMESDEVRTHSRIIADLLNPKGSHGQGGVFLQLFVEQLNNNKKNTGAFDIGVFDFTSAYIEVEHYAGLVTNTTGGRIDIFIKDKMDNVLLIENKIYAEETTNQMERYRGSFPKAYIVYLSLFTEESDKNKDIVDSFITYEKDILKWLNLCRKESIDLPILREGIAQYAHLIKKLTSQRNTDIMDEKIIDRITRDNVSLENYYELLNYREAVSNRIHKRFIQELKDELNKLSLNYDDISLNEMYKRYNGFTIYTPEMKEKNLGVFFEFGRNGLVDFYLGVGYFNNLEEAKEYSQEIVKQINAIGYNYDKGNVGWLCSKYFDILCNWNTPECLIAMSNGEAIIEFKKEVTILKEFIEQVLLKS